MLNTSYGAEYFSVYNEITMMRFDVVETQCDDRPLHALVTDSVNSAGR
jgi:hypothetical protein